MSVVIVGGNERMECQYRQICKQFGYKAKVFTKMPADFKKQIAAPIWWYCSPIPFHTKW